MLAIPLVELMPGLIGLRDNVQLISTHVPNPKLLRFAESEPVTISRKITKSKLTTSKILELTEKFETLQTAMQAGEYDQRKISTILHEVLGDMVESIHLDWSYKDFYYLKAVFDGESGRHIQAIELLSSLVELDPCNMPLRHSLMLEINRLCGVAVKFDERANFLLDLTRIYALVRELCCHEPRRSLWPKLRSVRANPAAQHKASGARLTSPARQNALYSPYTQQIR